MPFHVTNLATYHRLDLNILFSFLSPDHTVRALGRQSSGKDVREPTKCQAVADCAFTKQESKMSQSEIKSCQGSSFEYEYESQVFESLSQSPTHTAASVHGVALRRRASLARPGNQAQGAAGEAPQILRHLQDLSVRCGDTARFLCVLKDEASVEVTWTHQGVKIEASGRVRPSQSGKIQLLTISDVQRADQGLYSCLVRNDYGWETSSARLSIEAKESQTRAVTKIAHGSDIKSIKTLKASQIKTTHEVKRESSKKTSSLSFTSCQSPQGKEKPGSLCVVPHRWTED
ncbi:myosin light chain kinase, smooth muscle-like [Canis lupus dingo]|uniref:myosin light chain kinase, smooth muscle-like n=1 Tax=Canis lupus dingo TaxID=286419 RepID=UPI0020C348B7|nr:myosin light chain kinase, smooth muscle-like [Canis lupus dingo]